MIDLYFLPALSYIFSMFPQNKRFCGKFFMQKFKISAILLI